MPKAAVMHDTSACVNHGYPSAPNPKPLKNNIHLNTTPPLRSQDPKKQLRGSTIEGFKHITNTLQNTPSYIHWKKKTLHPTSLQNTSLHPTSNHMCYFVGFGGFLEPFPATTNHILPAVFYTNQKVLVLGAGFAAAAILLSRIPTEAPLLARGWGLCTAPFGKVYAYRPCYQV